MKAKVLAVLPAALLAATGCTTPPEELGGGESVAGLSSFSSSKEEIIVVCDDDVDEGLVWCTSYQEGTGEDVTFLKWKERPLEGIEISSILTE